MKIVVICGAGIVSGKEIMSLRLLEGLKERNHSCICFTSYWGSREFRERLVKIGIPYHVMRIGFISKTLQWSAVWKTLHQLLHIPGLYASFLLTMMREKPQIIVHTNFHHLFLLQPVLPWRKRNVYWAHEIMPISSFYRNLFRLLTLRLDRIIAVSDATARPLIEFAGPERVLVVKNGMSVQPIMKRGKASDAPLIMAIVGQVAAHKGHEILLEALKLQQPFQRRLELWIVGEGRPEYESHLQELSRDLGLNEVIKWRGFQKEIEEIYRDVDLVVLPSIVPESFPTTIMECGLLGIPVVASAIGGIKEMIVEGYNGFTFETGNSSALAKTLDLVINCDLLTLSAQSRAHANLHFTNQRFIADFERALAAEIDLP